MDIRKVIIALVICCGLCAITATAGVPHLINYQAMLTDSTGQPLNRTQNLDFAIYADSSGGSSLWNETHTAVSVTDGLFHAILGSVQPIPETIFTGQVKWLETTVEGEILSPRTKIVTVPYSLKSSNSDHAVYADTAFQGNFWNLDGNSGTISGTHYIGTQDNQALELRVNRQRCVTWYPNATCPTLIGGYSGNSGIAGVAGATLSGGGMNGYPNSVTDCFGTVAGGRSNQVGNNNANTWDNPDATVGGGIGNTASKTAATVAGGSSNTASNNFSTVGGGYQNTASGWYSAVNGGRANIANNGYAAVGGGYTNTASGDGSIVGGGIYNTASGYGSTVCGGTRNMASGQYSAVSGGGGPDADDINEALGDYSTLGGGNQNTASGDYSFVGGGWGNYAIGSTSTVSGGCNNHATEGAITIAGGGYNYASGYSATVGGGFNNRARGDYSVVAGGGGSSPIDSNSTSGSYSSIGGGRHNSTSGINAAISGGFHNDANGNYSYLGGGFDNEASGDYAMVGGGYSNEADGDYGAVGGGNENSAYGYASTVPGGSNNIALNRYSFAAGHNARATSVGTFVWADSTDTDFYSGGINTFNVRASGGIRMYTNANLSFGVTLDANDNTWNSVCDSTKKTVLCIIDSRDILDRVAKLPIKRWKFKNGDPNIEHISPMAQDFWNLFHVGSDSLKISTIDPSGIALAAIQQLYIENQEVRKENLELQKQLNELRDLVLKLTASLQNPKNDNTSSTALIPRIHNNQKETQQ